MKPIRIIDIDFNLLSEIDDYESLMWTRKFYSVSEFEFRINQNKRHTNTLQIENIVIFGDLYGIILYKELAISEDGKKSETLIVKGVSLTGLIARRITMPPIGAAYDSFNTDAETIMKSLIDHNVIHTSTERVMQRFTLAENKHRGSNILWQSRYKQLDAEIESISYISNLGYVVYPDFQQQKFIFDVYQGKSLTASQTDNNPVIFSTEFDNIMNQNSIDSVIGFKNCAIVAGQGEGVDRAVTTVGNNESGFNRREVFIDARDVENANDLPMRGTQKLSEFPRILTLEADIVNATFKYKRDWDLGDFVTVQNTSWNLTLDAVITETKEIYEAYGTKLSVVFGNAVPTFLDRIKQGFEQTSQEVRR